MHYLCQFLVCVLHPDSKGLDHIYITVNAKVFSRALAHTRTHTHIHT